MSICPRCKTQFACGVADGGSGEPCWCMRLPPLPKQIADPASAGAQCLCPRCLQRLAAMQEQVKASDH